MRRIIIVTLISIFFTNISHARYDFGFSDEANAENTTNSYVNETNANNHAYYQDYKESPPSYDVHNLESDAQNKESNDQNAKLLKKSYETNNLKFRGDESFLSQNRDIMINGNNPVNLNYSSCKDLEFNCFDYKNPTTKSCISDLINKDYGNHFFNCSEYKAPSLKSCTETNEFSCKEAGYNYPKVNYNNFQGVNYSFPNLYLGIKRNHTLRQNCSGHYFYYKFHIEDPSQIEEFTLNDVGVDDSFRFYFNNNLLYNNHDAKRTRCELYRFAYHKPNVNLAPYLKKGENVIKFQVIVGGLGGFWSRFTLKYKTCQQFNKTTSNNCTLLESNPNCKKQGDTTCSRTAANDYILGKKVTECLEYKTSYNCIDEDFDHDKCDQFRLDTQCSIHTSSCKNYNEEFGECLHKESKFECDYKKEFDNYDNIDYEFTYDVNLLNYDESNCQNYKNDPNSCKLSDKKCLLTDQNNICHKYQNNYECQNNPNSKCNILSKECNFLRSTCTEFDNHHSCLIENKHYFCPNKINNINNDNNDILMCDMSDYITNNQDEEEENDFGNAISNMKMLEEAGDDFINDPLSIFTGESNTCEQDKVGYNDCCKAEGWGDDIGIGECSYDEEKLKTQSKNKQCIYVGSHCSKKVLGKCIKNQHSYCCFNSKIAKLIQEQGKAQLGQSFGSSNAPNCAGLTESDIVNVDFSKMDFSEITDDIISKTKPHDPNNFNNLAKEKIKEFFDKHKN